MRTPSLRRPRASARTAPGDAPRAAAGVVSRTASRTALLAVVGLVLAGCASLQDPDAPQDLEPGGPTEPVPGAEGTSLEIRLDVRGDGTVRTTTSTCDPAGGDHPDPDAACAALDAAGGARAFAPPPSDEVCTEQYGGPQVAEVEGTVDGQQVSARFSRVNGCEISRWDALAPLLGHAGGVEEDAVTE
jgi:hypothetical protein